MQILQTNAMFNQNEESKTGHTHTRTGKAYYEVLELLFAFSCVHFVMWQQLLCLANFMKAKKKKKIKNWIWYLYCMWGSEQNNGSKLFEIFVHGLKTEWHEMFSCFFFSSNKRGKEKWNWNNDRSHIIRFIVQTRVHHIDTHNVSFVMIALAACQVNFSHRLDPFPSI